MFTEKGFHVLVTAFSCTLSVAILGFNDSCVTNAHRTTDEWKLMVWSYICELPRATSGDNSIKNWRSQFGNDWVPPKTVKEWCIEFWHVLMIPLESARPGVLIDDTLGSNQTSRYCPKYHPESEDLHDHHRIFSYFHRPVRLRRFDIWHEQ